jgi:hypothetical protein
MSKTFGQLKANDKVYIIKGCNVEIVKVQSAELNTAKTAVFIISEECDFSVYAKQSSCHYGMKTGDIYCNIDEAMRAMQDICAKALHDYKEASGALNKLETLKRK